MSSEAFELPTIAIKTQWDPGRELWIAYSTNITAISVEAKTKPELEQKTLEALNEYGQKLTDEVVEKAPSES